VQATTTDNASAAKVSYFGEVGPDNGVSDASNGVTVDAAPVRPEPIPEFLREIEPIDVSDAVELSN
jgi:hypothetical protein